MSRHAKYFIRLNAKVIFQFLHLNIIAQILPYKPSEIGAQRKLHDASRGGGGGLAESCVQLISGEIEARRRVPVRELRMVESVVELAAELELHALLHQGEILEDRDVPIVDAGTADYVAGRVAGRT